jgi:molybdenum cofactor biosynthesis enzyme MoaA
MPTEGNTNELGGRLHRLQLTMGWQCNVRCRMCYQTDWSAGANMPAAIYRDRLRDWYPHVDNLKLIGGEPTIMRNCREVAALVRRWPGLKLDVHTNGVRVDGFWHEAFVAQAGLVAFSLNAATEATYDAIVVRGSFGAVTRNVERLVAARAGALPEVRLTTVILRQNVHELAALVRLAASLGADAMAYGMDPILSRSGLPPRDALRAELRRAREAADETGVAVLGLGEFERDVCPPRGGEPRVFVPEASAGAPCRRPCTELVVDADGDVRVCCNTWVKVGSARASTFDELRRGAPLAAFRERIRRSNYLWCSPTCRDNPRPHRLALAHKAWTYARRDPADLVRRVRNKAAQLRDR